MGVFAYDRDMPGCLVKLMHVTKTMNCKMYNHKNVQVLQLLKHSGIPYEKARSNVLCGSAYVKVIGNSL